MRKPVLALLALFALIPLAQALAQTAPVAVAPAQAAAAPAPDTAQFLATLAGVPAQTSNDLTPAPLFKTSCTSSAQCPSGQLCCNACGNPPDGGGSCLACMNPIRGRCPLIQ